MAYILRLLAELKADEQSEDQTVRRHATNRRKSILDMLGSETQLRSKRELIEQFITEQMPHIALPMDVESAFGEFWQSERERALDTLCADEGLDQSSVKGLIDQYHFTGRAPLREQVVAALLTKPKILQRKAIIERVTDKLMSVVRTFDNNIGDF